MSRYLFALLALIFSSVFSAMANAATFSGQCQLTEVEPIMELRYVSETCYRYYDCNCDTNPDGSPGFCQTCSESYECGGNQWFRIGSKPLRPVMVTATLNTVKVGETAPDQVYAPASKCAAQIDVGFKPIQLAQATMQTKAGVTNAKVEVLENRADLLTINISAETVELNPTEILDYLKVLKLKSRSKIEFPALKNMDYLSIQTCVAKDKRFTDNEKMFGCQYTPNGFKGGDFVLSEIDLDRPVHRNWIYTFSFMYEGKYNSVRRIVNWK